MQLTTKNKCKMLPFVIFLFIKNDIIKNVSDKHSVVNPATNTAF